MGKCWSHFRNNRFKTYAMSFYEILTIKLNKFTAFLLNSICVTMFILWKLLSSCVAHLWTLFDDGQAQALVARTTPLFSNFLFTNLFSIKFLYFFIISSLFPYFNLFVSIFIQSYANIKLHVLTLIDYRHGMCFRASSVFVLSILFWSPQRTHYFWRVFRFLFMEHKQDYSMTSVKDVKVCF
jgi:hypothetical protein